eukprot:13858982-Ditylum_brightwellii.AAC.1
MKELIFQCKIEGAEVCLMVDANEGIDDKAFGDLIAATEMNNIIGAYHGINTPNTHLCGRKAIGFICGTCGVLEATEQTGALKFYGGIFSDH